MFSKIGQFLGNKPQPLDPATPRVLHLQKRIRQESDLARTMWGPLPGDIGERLFFCDEQGNWHWHEKRKDAQGHWREFTKTYELRHDGVFLRQYSENQQGTYRLVPISTEETINFCDAAERYVKLAYTNLYMNAGAE